MRPVVFVMSDTSPHHACPVSLIPSVNADGRYPYHNRVPVSNLAYHSCSTGSST
ncbi:hypothetical protein BSAE_1902 [Bifidobacterium pullorum subsp. saeculare DSM 6531 = LMG 14934]|uniref:Uncharacterized protein n=1 Tax=Bifidobacterium pullorum subsp. saeculare DSM 6531 = LMG 14934 TaxID=1437611 RepID=A0A087CPX4_9BIFI|nr:hypothetical protein BSAE_1902 [Bifidobacterium pullorum subsp. saeculare DSM 6531 = LMG 14934]